MEAKGIQALTETRFQEVRQGDRKGICEIRSMRLEASMDEHAPQDQRHKLLPPCTLEQALGQLEQQAEILSKTVAEAAAAVKRLRAAARVGNLAKLRPTLEQAGRVVDRLQHQLQAASHDWQVDEPAYLASRAFQDELLAMAKQIGVDLYPQAGSLYAHPVVLRVCPKECAVSLDRIREKRLRPSVLLQRVKARQRQPSRFKPQEFLEVLWAAYEIAVMTRGKHLLGTGTVIPVVELYRILTLLPSQSRDYSRHEFARDLYLLDKSGLITCKKGYSLHFHASTGTRDASRILSVATQAGRSRSYYGISFLPPS
ncbi:MAG: hypothetical protein D6704_01770 [Nitrospirae bacterium]|nr:MAG: hypothetical protein D6704_01770 [Nitrospirota bacterium]